VVQNMTRVREGRARVEHSGAECGFVLLVCGMIARNAA